MMGTRTSNFSDVAVGDVEARRRSTAAKIRSPDGLETVRSTQELDWLRASCSRSGEAGAAAEEAGESATTPRPSSFGDDSEVGRPCIVELLHATNLPSMCGPTAEGSGSTKAAGDLGGTNAFVTMKIVPSSKDGKARPKGTERRWPFKNDTCFPIWNKARDLGRFVEGDTLKVALHHHGKAAAAGASQPRLLAANAAPIYSENIGGADMVLQAVEYDREYCIVVNSKLSRGVAKVESALPMVLRLRFLKPPVARKTVFLIRHAESKWNRAQRRNDLVAMAQVDHGLSQDGREQVWASHWAWRTW